MSEITITESPLGTALGAMLMHGDIEPGAQASYQVCKDIYLYHPLGAKMADSPIKKAQSQRRDISIPGGPESRVRDAFNAEWMALGADAAIANLGRVARIYGFGSIILVVAGQDPRQALDFAKLPGRAIAFNVLDPLNTAGATSLNNQDPNSLDYQRPGAVSASGKAYHRSRSCTLLNENPLFISYTSSAFGFSGRSIYQRALHPLKTFVQTMITDEWVTRKAGLLVAKIKQPGGINDKLQALAAGLKRSILREAKVDNVISIGGDDDIASLNLQGIDTAAGYARKNALENCAVAADMPAKMLNQETFAEGFGEGTEDAKNVAAYIDGIRVWLDPAYAWMDNIVQYRAWTPEFYATIQADFPEEYSGVDYQTAFVEWRNAFKATWPSLLVEPDSEKVKVEEIKAKNVVALLEVLLPRFDPENAATTIQWAIDNIGENKLLFPNPLVLDMDALREYVPPAPPPAEPGEPTPFSAET